jgi:hypothetical protein
MYPPHIPHALPSSLGHIGPRFVFRKYLHSLLCRVLLHVFSQWSRRHQRSWYVRASVRQSQGGTGDSSAHNPL